MRKVQASQVGIDQGNEELFSDFAHGGEMWTGSGARERRKTVTFSEAFKTPPAVYAGLSLWDVAQGANMRADIQTDNVTETSFELVFRTWSDTRVARARMSWIAIGEIKGEDDWELY